MLMPGRQTPNLNLPTLDHGEFDLDSAAPREGTLLVFYRGLHCPICIKQLGELEEKLDSFADLGVDVVAISTDGADRAQRTKEKAGTERLKIAHSLKLPAARFDWGLWISSQREGSEEPKLFSEPGLFYVRPDRTLYFGWVQTSPFARPQVDDIIGAIRFQQEKDYPPRGQYDGTLDADAA